ncbi:hypothetical protein BH11CYA1_BH11CYA1_16240 [soil metagenome]
MSDKAANIQQLVSKPVINRKIVGYNRDFLESYRPNKSTYLSDDNRARLHALGAVPAGTQPAGTYARKILDRLLIDLSWNSSRLEGNTYTLLDTKHLIEFGKEAEGKNRIEAQMILNHKEKLREAIGTFVRGQHARKEALKFLDDWSAENLPSKEREEFIEVAEAELLALHEGNFARYRIRPSEYEAWQKVWNRGRFN